VAATAGARAQPVLGQLAVRRVLSLALLVAVVLATVAKAAGPAPATMPCVTSYVVNGAGCAVW
jgi:hypothetical protein